MNSAQKIKYNLATLFASIGMGSAIYLSLVYYKVQNGLGGSNLCNISEKMNCNAVAMSSWADFFFGIPTSSLVAGWMLTLLALSLFIRMEKWFSISAQVGFALSLIASLFSLHLLYVQAFELKTFCLFCLIIDLCSFILLGIFWSLVKQAGSFIPENKGKIMHWVGMLLISCFIMVLILKPIESNEEKEHHSQIALVVDSILNSSALPIPTPPEAPVLGNVKAPIEIQEFSDFQCPHCQKGAKILETILMKYKDQVKVVFRGFPLDSSCNRKLERAAHPYACILTRGAYCANEQGKFHDYYTQVFDQQEKLDAESYSTIAKEIGLNLETFKTCVDSEKTKKQILDSVEEAIRLSVASTPTFFVNGHKVEGAIHPKAWSAIIDKLLKK